MNRTLRALVVGCLLFVTGLVLTQSVGAASSPESALSASLDHLDTALYGHLLWRYLADPRSKGEVRRLLADHDLPVRRLISRQWDCCRPERQLQAATDRVQDACRALSAVLASLSPDRRGRMHRLLHQRWQRPGLPLPLKFGYWQFLGQLIEQETSSRLQERVGSSGSAGDLEELRSAFAELQAEVANRPPEREFRELANWFRVSCRSIEPSATPDGAPVFLVMAGPVREPAGGRRRGAAALPTKFLWGVSTSGVQYEGDNPAGIWEFHEKAGKVKEPIRRAADGLHRYEEDLRLAAGMGLNAFRTSIEWSRIEPRPGQIDPEAVAFYHRFFQAMRRNGLQPVVTLVHFSWPRWLEEKGGWTSEAGVQAFCRHVGFVAREFGSEVDWWLTYNEPPVILLAGYVLGNFPPGYKNPLKALAVSRSWIRCHRLAYQILHREDPVAFVSWNNYTGTYNLGGLGQIHLSVSGSGNLGTVSAPAADESLAQVQKQMEDEWLRMGLPSRWGEKSKYLDYIGIDYYCRWRLPGGFSEADVWEPYPEGLYQVLKNYHSWFKVPVLIAENGMATRNLTPRGDGWTREAFLVQHVKQVQRARRDGIPVLGYLHWSITDNYELGTFDHRFGLYSVDCRNENFTRVPTPAADLYRRIVAADGITPDMEIQFPAPLPAGR